MTFNINKFLLGMFVVMCLTFIFFLAFGYNNDLDINNDMDKLLTECINNEEDDMCIATYNVLDRLCQWEYFDVCFSDKYAVYD